MQVQVLMWDIITDGITADCKKILEIYDTIYMPFALRKYMRKTPTRVCV